MAAALCCTASAAGDDWQTVYDSEGLRILKRDYAGSALDEIKGVLRVKASLNAVMALLKDADFNQHWVYRSGGARILKESGYAQAYVYGVVDAPPPMSDRDTVVRFDYRQHPVSREITVTITNVPDFIAPVPGLVRVPQMGGYWHLKPDAQGWVQVTYQVHGDPGGWIPAWLANHAALVSVKQTLLNLADVVPRYEGLRSEYVREAGQSSAR
ncbi:MAG: hypothetical protein KDI17_01785 [Halioglobus sp.]|nr:hypothetical protein [Halioglobus sp.]